MQLTTKRQVQSQVIFCQGCCCGRTDRGKPEFPAEQLKEIWRNERLNRTVQLTISGCLGPCDLTNVALVITPEENVWLGGMAGGEVYEAIVNWARSCHEENGLTPLPEILRPLRFDRFQMKEALL